MPITLAAIAVYYLQYDLKDHVDIFLVYLNYLSKNF